MNCFVCLQEAIENCEIPRCPFMDIDLYDDDENDVSIEPLELQNGKWKAREHNKRGWNLARAPRNSTGHKKDSESRRKLREFSKQWVRPGTYGIRENIPS